MPDYRTCIDTSAFPQFGTLCCDQCLEFAASDERAQREGESRVRLRPLTPKHHESDTHVHRGRITKQGSKLVRWAAVESVKRLGPHTGVGAFKAAVAARRSIQGGKNIATVAAAHRQIEHVYYALRDGHVRALQAPQGRHPARPPARRPVTRARGAA